MALLAGKAEADFTSFRFKNVSENFCEVRTRKGVFYKTAKLLRPGEERCYRGQVEDRMRQVIINVGGIKYRIPWTTLEDCPLTRLGKLKACNNYDEIMDICDDYDINCNEFFFDRNPCAFRTIMTFLAAGKLRILREMCALSFQEELIYWGIEEEQLEWCCLRKLQQKEEELAEAKMYEGEYGTSKENSQSALQDSGRLAQCMKHLRDMVENPHSGIPGKIFACLSVSFVAITAVSLCISTMPDFRDEEDRLAIFIVVLLAGSSGTQRERLRTVSRVFCLFFPLYLWVVQDTGVNMDIQGLSSWMDNLTTRVQNIQDFVVQNPMSEPRIPIPDLFFGDRSKFLNFKNNCKLFLALKPRSSGDPVQQVKITISLLRGDPQDWGFSLAPGDPALRDVDAFFLALGLLYDEPNSVDQAEKILLALCQGQDEAEIYCQKFRKWSVLTQWNECALAAIFRKGLSEALKDVMVGFPMPAGLNESMSLAIQIDRRLRERKAVHHLALVFCFAGSSETQRVYRRAVSSARLASFLGCAELPR
ncbi:unnamed protein product [Ranitomeya imitator]|uniref:Potassium channel tetramerisation-type BTB domain-containing protein n=1 Tax=Ranitomeya imitator TaxID=111125 RepID=A0ABN9LA00_9NEOB|nr:unnamed protein product [Ranitomeya imitator]